jgi:hypothetical protein
MDAGSYSQEIIETVDKYSQLILVIETVNDELKNICQIEHIRHRSFTNFVINLIAG